LSYRLCHALIYSESGISGIPGYFRLLNTGAKIVFCPPSRLEKAEDKPANGCVAGVEEMRHAPRLHRAGTCAALPMPA
jgi:hypothetical protein